MSSSYTIRFSDPTTSSFIVVPGASVGTGKNNYDTSLDLVGPGYVNFGQSIAQNFVKLLENFASPYPPLNPIKGQLWYDTSNPDRYVLRVNNGTVTSSRWPNANGIYQQSFDPYVEYPANIKEGDIWVDTSVNQLKIRYSGGWTLVGPSTDVGANKTGAEAVILQSNTGTSHRVILNWVNGKVVEIISGSEFTPRTVLDGFSTIKSGTNLTSKNNARYNGISEKTIGILLPNGTTIQSSDILRNRATSQTHTGTFAVESQLIVKLSNNSENLKVSTTSSGGVVKANIDFSNTVSNSTFKIGIKDNSYLIFNSNRLTGVNTGTAFATLDVYGSGRYLNTLTVLSTSPIALSVGGGVSVGGTVESAAGKINGQFTVTGATTVGAAGSGVIINPAINDVYDLGTTATQFRHVFAYGFGSTGLTKFYGTLTGSASTLQSQRNFSIAGQVTSTIVGFNGSLDVVLTATLSATSISQQPITEDTTLTQTLLVLNTATSASGELERISKKSFLADVYPYVLPPGAIIPWGRNSAPTQLKPNGMNSWLLCNGGSYSRGDYPELFAVISTNYGASSPSPGQFFVPNLTTTDANADTIYYIIKT